MCRLPSLRILLLSLVLPLCGQTNSGTTVIDDYFADGTSQVQDLATNRMWLFNGRTTTIRTDQVGAITYDMTPVGSSSEAFWAYFTASGAPVTLGIGDTLSVSVTFSVSGFLANGQDVRWGVLDSQGTRNTAILSGGMNDASFIGDTGYGLDYYPSGTGSPFVIGRRTVLSNANVFNNFGDFATINGAGSQSRQTLVENAPYTLTYQIKRISATDTKLMASMYGGDQPFLNYSATESSPTPNTTFDYFAFRVSGAQFSTKITWYELLVQYTPAPPAITVQPQPSSLTIQVGNSVSLAVGATGSGLSYQWLKDGQPVSNHDSATLPTLNLSQVQRADQGVYTARVSNAGGDAVSNPVILNVSETPVPPPPMITRQPVNSKAVAGTAASFSVAATGDNLFYQWFKNGSVLPGMNGSELRLINIQVADSGAYNVVVSNSSGSVASSAATLLVVSGMVPVSFSPAPGALGTCTDASVSVQFDQPPVLGKTGKITVTNSSGNVVDTINMASNPQTRSIGGVAYVYYPVRIEGRNATITFHQALDYNDTYSITMDPGVVLDATGAPFTGIAEASAWRFSTRATAPAAGLSTYTVALDNSGDFCSVQSAIDMVPAGNSSLVRILVRQGIYTEINYVPSNKPLITIRGEDRDKTIIQYSNNANLNSGNSRAMFGVDAPDFTLQDITLWNTTPHGGSQAEAFRGNNSRIVLNRVNLKSYQDTLLLQGLGFVTDSYIEGDVDFMWGNGTVFLQNSELRSVTSGGYYTQIRNAQNQNGYVFLNCRLTAPDGVSGDYLARIDPTAFPYSQVVYINTQMGPHIAPAGWLLNNATAAPNVQFWEYNSTDLTGKKLDVSQRLNVSRQLMAQEAEQWADPAFVLGGWVPVTVNATLGPKGIGVRWTAPPTHSPDDVIALFEVGSPDSMPIAGAKTGKVHVGTLVLPVPSASGAYIVRYVPASDAARRAISNSLLIP